MTTTSDPRRPILARLLSMEGLFGAFGLYSLGTGLWRGEAMPLFWGATILLGLGVLAAVRRRDWQRHWHDLEAQRQTPPGSDRNPPPDE